MNYTNWPKRWQAALDACTLLGGEARELVIDPAASERSVAAVETALACKLPYSFRAVLTDFSAHVEVGWFLPDDAVLPSELREIFSGECHWGLQWLVQFEESRKKWIELVFPNINDPYDCVWHNKLAFAEVANGDYLALDLELLPDAPVVYLRHDDGEGHGYRLGSSFADFIDRYSLLGCPGHEDLQMLPFISSPTDGLNPNSENAKAWRQWFGLNV